MAALGTGATFVSTPVAVLSSSASDFLELNTETSNADLARVEVRTQISPVRNELEIVLTNTSPHTTRLTHITPAEIRTARGTFDLQSLLDSGDLIMAAGDSVTVPMQHHPVVLDASDVSQRSQLLTDALKQNLSIITEGEALAAVSIVNGPHYA